MALGSTGVGCADDVFPAIQARVAAPFGQSWIREQVCALSEDAPADFECVDTGAGHTIVLTPLAALAFPEGASNALIAVLFASSFVALVLVGVFRQTRHHKSTKDERTMLKTQDDRTYDSTFD